MDVQKYARNPLTVEAVQVTEENVYEVAKWCGGDVVSHKMLIPDAVTGRPTEQKRIVLDTLRPLYKKHTEAIPGDWILKSDHGFKIYADVAFTKGFTKIEEPTGIVATFFDQGDVKITEFTPPQ